MSSVTPERHLADVDLDSLIEIIKSTTSPETWDYVGGPGTLSTEADPPTFVVDQYAFVHDEIQLLLDALANSAARTTSGESHAKPSSDD